MARAWIYKLIVDGLEKDRKTSRDQGDVVAQLLRNAVFYLKKGASCAQLFGPYFGRDDVLWAEIKTADGKIVVSGGIGSVAVCVGCGALIQSRHQCVKGEKCSVPYQEGTTFLAHAPNDHPCAALFHAQQDSQYLVGFDNPTTLPNIPEWEMIQDRQTGGRGHHYYWYARRGISVEELTEFFKKHPATSDFSIDVHGNCVVINATNLGPWIGSGGRWAKAYQRLGLNVEFRELRR